jgi:serine/threonine-protein kinase
VLSKLLRELLEVAAPPALPAGTEIGRFELGRVLGSGAFGVVYEARDRVLGRSVAFKLVRPGSASGADQLVREAGTVARLAHPNIVSLFDFGRSEHGPYLVLELLRGQTLSRRIGEKPLATLEAVRIARDVARGLAHAHAEGVCHRDLKPDNVFLTEAGPVKVLDFGLAHALGHERLAGGTPRYMAPEQWRGGREDERTDLFALGVMLHRMLTGRYPFPDDEGCWVERSEPAPPLDVPGVPELGVLVARMLERDPARRPGDAEVVDALERAVDELGGGRRRQARLLLVALPAAALLALLGLGTGAAVMGRSQPGGPSVAVLPFADLSPGGDQAYLSDGVAEEILTALARVEGLQVGGRTSSFSIRGRDLEPDAVGRRLGVDHLLQGSVRRSGSRLRIAAELVRAGSGERLWRHSFDRDDADLFAVQEEIAQAVVEALRVRLLPGQAPLVQGSRAVDPEVHRLFLLARYLVARSNPADARTAIQVLQQALKLDPAYVDARALLAYATWSRADMGPLEEREAADAAFDPRLAGEAALREAEELGRIAPDHAETRWMRAFFRSCISWNWAGAVEDYERALELAPGDSRLRLHYAGLLAVTGRLAEAQALARRVAAQDPLHGDVYRWLGVFQAAAGDAAGAAATLRRGLEVAPEHAQLQRELGYALLLAGRPEDALALFDRHPVAWMRDVGLALAHHRLGHDRESRQALGRLLALDQHAHLAPGYQIAEVYAWRGETDEAFRWLERGLADRDSGMNYLLFDPLLRGLRGDPRYRDLVRRMGLPAERILAAR